MLVSLLFSAFVFAASSQPVAMEGKVDFQKSDKAAAVIELPYSPEVVKGAIKEYMLRKGIKPDKVKDFEVYRGARLAENDAEVTDLYFKVEKKSRKDKNTSLVYLIPGRPSENIALRTSNDTHKIYDGKHFLNEMVPAVESHNLEVSITEQDDILKKSEKKLSNLQKDQQDFESKIRNLEEKLEKNKREQDSQNEEISKQRAVRDAMTARRRM